MSRKFMRKDDKDFLYFLIVAAVSFVLGVISTL